MAQQILFYISHGHGQDGDPGAVSGKFVERDLAIKVAEACYKRLLAEPNKTFKTTYPERRMGNGGMHLWQDNIKTEAYDSKYRVVSVDIHFNAGKGDGMEVWTNSKNKYADELAGYIESEFKRIGQNYHGQPTKHDGTLQFLHNAGVAVLVECGFVDNVTDRKLFDTDKELARMGEAIAKGLITYAKKYD